MALYHSPLVVTDGLILYLDAANPRSYPGTGTRWYDISGNGLYGDINSGEFISGQFGGYLQNANNQSNFFYISFPRKGTLTLTPGMGVLGGWVGHVSKYIYVFKNVIFISIYILDICI